MSRASAGAGPAGCASTSCRATRNMPRATGFPGLRAVLAADEERPLADRAVRIAALREELDRATRRVNLIPYIDPLDVRYKRFEARPKPMAQAVMFCLMDVSGSMTEHMKDLAKRFYIL